MRKKEDFSYIDSSLRTIMDIYPSFSEILNNKVPQNINGILFIKYSHEFIVIEDIVFKPHFRCYNNIWRYKEKIFLIMYVNNGEELK